jgi:hypothetical protein
VPGRYEEGDDPLVYLVTSVERVLALGVRWLVSDGNAAVAITRFTDAVDRLDSFVDWPLMRESFWAGTPDDPDRQRRRMAELLVHRRLSLQAVVGFATRTPGRADELRRVLAAAGRSGDYVAVRPDWYYGYTRTGVDG